MRLLTTLLCFCLFHIVGCKYLTMGDSTAQSKPAVLADPRLLERGVVRLRSMYALTSGQFRSTCTGTLIHVPDNTLNECVVLTAAQCYSNLPKNSEHSVEFLDTAGRISKAFRVGTIVLHPDYSPNAARDEINNNAFDVALVRFGCSLPVSIKASRILDYTQVPIDSNLLIASYQVARSDNLEKNSESTRDGSSANEAPLPSELLQTKLNLRSFDFPNPKNDFLQENLPGVFSVGANVETKTCEVDSGGAAFFNSGNDLYLVATMSKPSANCDRDLARLAISSPHISWIESVVGKEVISYVKQTEKTAALLNLRTLSSQSVSAIDLPIATPHATPSPALTLPKTTVQSSNTAEHFKVSAARTPAAVAAKIPTPAAMATQIPVPAVVSTKPSVSKLPAPTSKLPAPAPAKVSPPTPPESIPDSTLVPDDDEESIPPVVIKTPAPQPGAVKQLPVQPTQTVVTLIPQTAVPPIPAALPEAATSAEKSQFCEGKTWTVRAKTRVWGTVIKLLDKETSQIFDDTQKCDFPNESELCLVGNPTPTGTGTGNSRGQLLQDIDLPGCEKFRAGKTIYIFTPDFASP
ncbi:hypothetical protein EBU99_00085 [bacterium]|nr:hypothetical protein [bacterium]